MGLHVCVMYNALETALVLLENGAAVNRMPNGKTPLHVACEVANSDFVALLLAHGAKVNSLSLSGHTPLHYCVTAQAVDCAKQLILKGEEGRMCDWMKVQIQTTQPQNDFCFLLMKVQQSMCPATATRRTHLCTQWPGLVSRSCWVSTWPTERLWMWSTRPRRRL